jgi:stage II sporulation protein M
MKFETTRNLVCDHFQNNMWLYILSTLCLSTGIVFGVYAVKYMDATQKSTLITSLSNFIKSTSFSNVSYNQIMFESIKNNVPMLIVVWFLGMTMIGIPIILMLDIIKGFTMGFTVTFLINGMGYKGIWLSLLSVLPQNLVYIPCIVIASVISMKFSLTFLSNNAKKHLTNNLLAKLLTYSMMFMIIISVMFIGVSFEAYVSPNVIKLIALSGGSVIV